MQFLALKEKPAPRNLNGQMCFIRTPSGHRADKIFGTLYEQFVVIWMGLDRLH
jgi:hypothetical protein